MIYSIVDNVEDEALIADVSDRVDEMCETFPLYPELS